MGWTTWHRRWPARMAALALVAAAGVVAPSEPAISRPRQDGGPQELLVAYRPGVTSAQRAHARQRADADLQDQVVAGEGAKGEVELVRVRSRSSRSAAARRLQEDPSVAYAEPNSAYGPALASADPYYVNGSLWGTYGDASPLRVNRYGSQAAEAWAAGNTGSRNVYVAVIDQGIQLDHPDLAGQVWTNPFDPADGVDNDGNGYVDDVHGWDFDGGDSSVYDGGAEGNRDDHGTHVAGTIGARSDGAGTVGVSWEVTLIPVKFLGAGSGTTANAVKAMDYVTDLKRRHGLNVVATNNSWGGAGWSQALYEAIERARAADILVVAAAGNGGGDAVGDNNDASPYYPASYPNDNVVSVAAITSGGARAGFSNYGRSRVDLGAPGSGIWSTTAYNTYSPYSGTSMATPHVTGGAALYAARHPGAGAAAIKAALLSTAVPTASLAGRTVTGGRLDLSAFGRL